MSGKTIAKVVQFSEIDCCSLIQTFILNVPLLNIWFKVVSPEKIRILVEILQRTKRLEFTPSHEISAIYSSFIGEGLELLRSGPKRVFPCPHSNEQHIKALEGLQSRFEALMVSKTRH